eukprot:10244887-Alexandrium_andersonii.AAC.1
MPCLAEVAIQKSIVRRKSQTEAWAAVEVVKMACFLQGLRLAIKHGKAPNEFCEAAGSVKQVRCVACMRTRPKLLDPSTNV